MKLMRLMKYEKQILTVGFDQGLTINFLGTAKTQKAWYQPWFPGNFRWIPLCSDVYNNIQCNKSEDHSNC